jgi:hypothetical protein
MPLMGQYGSSGGGPRSSVTLLPSSAAGDSGANAVAITKGEAMSILSEIARR